MTSRKDDEGTIDEVEAILLRAKELEEDLVTIEIPTRAAAVMWQFIMIARPGASKHDPLSSWIYSNQEDNSESVESVLRDRLAFSIFSDEKRTNMRTSVDIRLRELQSIGATMQELLNSHEIDDKLEFWLKIGGFPDGNLGYYPKALLTLVDGYQTTTSIDLADFRRPYELMMENSHVADKQWPLPDHPEL